MRWIEWQSGGETKRVLMVKDPIGIGRSATCEFAFPDDREVSRMHAIIERRGDHWFLADQKSTNGSFVNSQRVTVPFPLKDGDLIEIGDQRLHVKSGVDFRIKERPVASYAGYPHLYVLLKVAPTAPQGEVDGAYGALVKIYSPELHPESEMVKLLLQEIVEAYAILGDPVRRADYDATLQTQYLAASGPPSIPD